MTEKTKAPRKEKPAATPMRDRAMARLQAGASLAEIAAEVGIAEPMLSALLGEAATITWPKPPAPAEAAPTKRKPLYTKEGIRLGRAALWK